MTSISSKLFISILSVILILSVIPVTAQEQYPDKIFPLSQDWSVDCKIYRLTEKTVLVLFQGQESPIDIQRTSLKQLEYEDGRQVIFNRFGQIEGEITLSKPVEIREVLNPGLVKLSDGEEVVLNGIDFSLPTDSLSLFYFDAGISYIKSIVLRSTVQLQFDILQRDEFGRMIAYVILPGGLILNAEIIRRGFCPLDRGRNLIYLQDFKLLEDEARTIVKIGEEEGVIKQEEQEIIHNVFELDNTDIASVMTPRLDMFTFEAGLTIGKALKGMEKLAFSRIPVHQDSVDKIL